MFIWLDYRLASQLHSHKDYREVSNMWKLSQGQFNLAIGRPVGRFGSFEDFSYSFQYSFLSHLATEALKSANISMSSLGLFCQIQRTFCLVENKCLGLGLKQL